MGQYSSAKVHRTLVIKEKERLEGSPKSLDDYTIELKHLPGLMPEIYDGI